MLLLCAGVAFLANSLWILVLVLPLAIILQKGVIDRKNPISNRNLATNICATKPRSGAGSKITSRLAAFTLAGVEPVYGPQDF
jgi:hypothetical protein